MARWILAGLAGAELWVSSLLGWVWVGAVVMVLAGAWVVASFYGERLEHGPRRRTGGAS